VARVLVRVLAAAGVIGVGTVPKSNT